MQRALPPGILTVSNGGFLFPHLCQITEIKPVKAILTSAWVQNSLIWKIINIKIICVCLWTFLDFLSADPSGFWKNKTKKLAKDCTLTVSVLLAEETRRVRHIRVLKHTKTITSQAKCATCQMCVTNKMQSNSTNVRTLPTATRLVGLVATKSTLWLVWN